MDNINISICVTLIAAIFGIAYPILLQVISILDEKYNSIRIVSLFNRGYQRKFFIVSIGCSLLSIFLWVLDISPIFGWQRNSAEYLLILSTFILIISFFLLVKKIFIYYNPNKFLEYLKNENDRKVKDKDFSYLYSISDLLRFALRNPNEDLIDSIWKYLSKLFNEFKHLVPQNEVVKFPNEFYEVVSKTIEELVTIKSNRFNYLAQSTAGSRWLLSDLNQPAISEHTYDWIWKNFRLILSYDRPDFIFFHWENAYKYFREVLKPIPTKGKNQGEIEKREEEREDFLNFHCALGGLLLYKKKYELIGQMFKFTFSDPPDYVLLPKTMDEVFKMYFEFQDPSNGKYPVIKSYFRFEDNGGWEQNSLIRHWISSYVALLFLRQFTLIPFYSLKPLSYPRIPSNQVLKEQWKTGLGDFKSLVESIEANIELCRATGLDIITKAWLNENHKPEPSEFIDEVLNRI